MVILRLESVNYSLLHRLSSVPRGCCAVARYHDSESSGRRGIMRKAFYSALGLIISLHVLTAQTKLPAQAQRGQELFLKTTKGVPCGTCHNLAGVGTAVGPDLKVLGGAVGPHGIVMAMHMTMTAYGQE